jgi:DNA helicase II / ATP-dependent DNA helicase PcrA
MRFYADLHIHSKYSRATSRDCDLEHLALWARRKGITVLGTGDFTHPAWRAEIKEKLVPAEPGFYRLRPDLEAEVERTTPAACPGTTRFLLSVEISTIYKKGPRTRKVHHLVYVPSFDAADRFVQRLGRLGNLNSDGRPIIGLDSRHLLEIVLESDPGSYLIPAHVWTPWFSVLGSKSGFDSVAECYDDLASHVFAVETGLSSDPAMNWRVSSLDRYRLVSNSDAHSPQKLGREACLFDTDLDYFALRGALETGRGYRGTVEFFPEEGKYHVDGHRKCNVRFLPEETRAHDGLCPACGTPVTVGVLSRVQELADRPEGAPAPETASEVRSLVPLPEILAEINGTGPASMVVERAWQALTDRLGPELQILDEVPVEDIRRTGSTLLAEAIGRLRRGEVHREAGFDGEYGRIRLFTEEELTGQPSRKMFDSGDSTEGVAPKRRAARRPKMAKAAAFPAAAVAADAPRDTWGALDDAQRAAVDAGPGPLLIVAGPGSGKTRTLTQRIAHVVETQGVSGASCLAITFTRRAADEMRSRLHSRLGAEAGVAVHTFHSLGYRMLQEHAELLGMPAGFQVADELTRVRLVEEVLGLPPTEARRFLGRLVKADAGGLGVTEVETYRRAMAERNLLDFDDLVVLALNLLDEHPVVTAHYRRRYPWIFVDEYQDVDEAQYRLLKQLVAPDGHLCAVGDPNQSIYSFRGADVRFFHRFGQDFPGAQVAALDRNYRSTRTIVDASRQMLSILAAPEAAEGVDVGKVALHEAATERGEAEFVVATIERAIGGHSFFSIDSGRAGHGEGAGLGFADFAVLYRTEAQAAVLGEALRRSGLPFQQRSHARLVEHPGVHALLEQLRQEHGEGPLAASIDGAAEAVALQMPSLTDVEAGRELLHAYRLTCADDAARFWTEIPGATEADTWDPRGDRISLLTLHASKGLEFRVVFIVGCEDGLLPLRFGTREAAAMEEERRLFYVGMTRAREQLFLCRARKRLWRGQVTPRPPSPFLDAIEERLLAHEHGRPRAARREEPPVPQRSLFELE